MSSAKHQTTPRTGNIYLKLQYPEWSLERWNTTTGQYEIQPVDCKKTGEKTGEQMALTHGVTLYWLPATGDPSVLFEPPRS